MEVRSIYPVDLTEYLERTRRLESSKAYGAIASDLLSFLDECHSTEGPKLWTRLYHQTHLSFWRDDTIGSPDQLLSEPCRIFQVSVRGILHGNFVLEFTLPKLESPWKRKSGSADSPAAAVKLLLKALDLCEQEFENLLPFTMDFGADELN